MARITIMGDVVQIATELTRDEFTRIKDYAPEMLKLVDADGNEIFGVGIGDASFSKYGICFCSESADGKLFMTTNNPVTDHSDPEKEREEIVRRFAPVLSKLQAVEGNVASVKESIDSMEAEVRGSVLFAN